MLQTYNYKHRNKISSINYYIIAINNSVNEIKHIHSV